MALDYPEMVSGLVAIDIVPTHHVLSNVTMGWGLEAYHWFFMAQKAPFPEKLLCADLPYYIQYKLNKKGVGLEIFAPEAMKEYVRCTTPEQIHAVCNSHCGRHFKVIQAWSEWADHVQGCDLPTGHYPQEQRPDLVYKAVWGFLHQGQ